MKKKDLMVVAIVIVLLLPFFIVPSFYKAYTDFNNAHGMIMSFIKFAILATFGEMIGLRIRTGNFNEPGFGIIPRAIVWGFLGLWIKMSFVIFTSGVPSFLTYIGIENAIPALKGNLSWAKVFVAFCISAAMNTSFAPVFMTFHKITDTHIVNNGGTIAGFLKPIKFKEIFPSLNWSVQWNFVFKKTIPFFWIPAHTITFCLPENMQVLFAAFLGIVLGVLLSVAALSEKK